MPATPTSSSESVPERLGLLALVLVWGGLALFYVLQVSPEVLEGALVDTDAYMRLVRVRLLAETGAWFDGSIPRSNWPYGETLHWTRPLDVLILAGSWLFRPFVGLEHTIHLSGVWIAPLLLLALAAATSWAAHPFTGPGVRWVTMIAVMLQPTVLGYSRPGRPDHHPLILLAFVLALGFWIRALRAPSGARRSDPMAVGAGAAAGFGLWVSPEYLMALAVLLLGGVIAWLRGGLPLVHVNLRFTTTLTVATALALVVERGPDLLAVGYARISVVHLLVTVLAAGFWAAVARARAAGSDSFRRRLAVAALGALVCFGLLGAAYPDFFGGPMTSFTHPVVRFWLANVAELRPLLVPDDPDGWAQFTMNLGAAVFVLPLVVARWLREPRAGPRRARLLLVLAWAAFLPLALVQVRWVTYVQLLVAMGLAEVVVAVRERLVVVRAGAMRDLAHASAIVMLLTGPFLLGVWLDARAEAATLPDPSAAVAPACDYTALARHLGEHPELGSRPRTVAAMMDAGPALLYLTDHRVIATPYANEAGMVASWEMMNATDPGISRAIAAEREVDLVLLCPAREAGFFVPTDETGDTTLYGRLVAGRPPAWLRARALPDGLEGALLFERTRAGVSPP